MVNLDTNVIIIFALCAALAVSAIILAARSIFRTYFAEKRAHLQEMLKMGAQQNHNKE